LGSSFAWIDFADEDRRRVTDVISLFQDKSTVDELGLGVVRDTLSDILFPGLSTIQTRARYFFFVPWLYQKHENRGTPAAEIAHRARNDELGMIDSLVAAEDHDGVFGIQSGVKLERLASSVYWAGLGTWGIRHFDGSQYEYHRAFDRLRASRSRTQKDDDGHSLSNPQARSWDPNLPLAPAEFPKQATLQLTRSEAEYLQDRIAQLQPRPLLAHLVGHTRDARDTGYVWEHPERAKFSEIHEIQVTHAHNFAVITYGAAVLYNLILSEMVRNREWEDQYRARFNEWVADMDRCAAQLRAWNIDEFWKIIVGQHGRVTAHTKTFVDTWIDRCLPGQELKAIADDKATRMLIQNREYQLKRGRARITNQRALEGWQGSAGVFLANYRWFRAKVIVADILDGLGRKDGT
jgi:Family of unknown function (DUF6361)